jgi:hypothetical protein
VYLDSQHLVLGTDLPPEETKYKECLTLFSSAELPGGLVTPQVIEDAYGQVTIQSIQKGSYMDMWSLFALASVMGCRIKSVYPGPPLVRSTTIRQTLNRLVYPRVERTSTVAAVLWSRSSDKEVPLWTPNHFVPLLPMVTSNTPCEVVNTSDAKDTTEQNYPVLDLGNPCGILT